MTTRNNEACVVVLSGGQDSTTCLFWAKERYSEVHAITFDYGQRHAVEIDAAFIVGQMADVKSHKLVKLGNILEGTSPLVSNAPLEQYANHKSLPGGLEKTFVPMRNQLFLTVAANRAYCLGISNLVTGVCQEDSGGYPDCRKDFIDSLAKTSRLGTFTGEGETLPHLYIIAPLMFLTKAQSVQMAFANPKCWEALAYTHTAYDGKYPPTGHDHASLLRAKGFLEARRPDPLVLRAWRQGVMDLPGTSNYAGCVR